MPIVESIRNRNEDLVPAVLTRLVTAEEQQRNPQGAEYLEDTIGTPLMLNPQLAHVPMARCRDSRTVGVSERRTQRLEEPYRGVDIFLLFLGKRIPPNLELVGELDFPGHAVIIAAKEYA